MQILPPSSDHFTTREGYAPAHPAHQLHNSHLSDGLFFLKFLLVNSWNRPFPATTLDRSTEQLCAATRYTLLNSGDATYKDFHTEAMRSPGAGQQGPLMGSHASTAQPCWPPAPGPSSKTCQSFSFLTPRVCTHVRSCVGSERSESELPSLSVGLRPSGPLLPGTLAHHTSSPHEHGWA